jgi:hypothetical protein
VCILIFLFGDARQLYPYELARPKITSPICKPQGPSVSAEDDKSACNASDKSRPVSDAHLYVDLEKGGNSNGNGMVQSPSCASTSTVDHKPVPNSLSAASTVPGLERHGENCELSPMSSPGQSQGVSQPHSVSPDLSGAGSAHRWSFDFDTLPTGSPATTGHWDTRPQSQGEKTEQGAIPTFGPLTRVLSPIITRAQWEIVVRSALMAIVVALILGAVCLAVPARR